MKYQPSDIEPFGLKPYAVYGGVVYSFTCPATGDRVYDAILLEKIFATAQKKANKIIAERNASCPRLS